MWSKRLILFEIKASNETHNQLCSLNSKQLVDLKIYLHPLNQNRVVIKSCTAENFYKPKTAAMRGSL